MGSFTLTRTSKSKLCVGKLASQHTLHGSSQCPIFAGMRQEPGQHTQPTETGLRFDILFQIFCCCPVLSQTAVFSSLTCTSVIMNMSFGASVTGRATSVMNHTVILPLAGATYRNWEVTILPFLCCVQHLPF